jgi:hypothetical protein
MKYPLVLTSLLCLLNAHAYAFSWPEVQYPERARVETIAESMRMNGIPVRLYRFEVNRPVGEVRDFYRSAFGSKRVEPAMEGFTVIAAAQTDAFSTVRLRALGEQRTEGFVMQSRTDTQELKTTRNDFPMPSDSQLISQVESTDSGNTSNLMLLQNTHSTKTNVDFFVRTLMDRGLNVSRQAESSSGKLTAQTVWFNGKDKEALLVVQQSSQGSVVKLNVLTQLK